jgi:hypothetical protein
MCITQIMKNPEIRKLFGAEIPVWVRRHNGDSTVRHGIQMVDFAFPF